jgi:hypothetical protein
MTFSPLPSFSSSEAPRLLKVLVAIIAGVNISLSIFDPFIVHYFSFSLFDILAVSSEGMSSLYLWQPLTSLFLLHTSYDISITSLMHLSSHLMIFWFVGSSLLARMGTHAFLFLYFITGIIGGTSSYLFMEYFDITMHVTMSTAALFSFLLIWSLFFQEITFFLPIPLNPKWLVWGLLAIATLFNYAQGDTAFAIATLSPFFFTYCYSLIIWGLEGPFERLTTFDRYVRKFGAFFVRSNTTSETFTEHKIYDIHTGKAYTDEEEKDEQFLDAMLSKISKHGESSLSPQERSRLENISKTRNSR